MRNRAKETVLQAAAWHFYAEQPLPLETNSLLRILDQEQHRIGTDPPEDADALLSEYVADGVLVARNESSYRFVLRSFHEYCIAGHLAFWPPEQAREYIASHASSEAHRELWPLLAGQAPELCDELLDVMPEGNGRSGFIGTPGGGRFKLLASILREYGNLTKKARTVAAGLLRELDVRREYDWEYNDWQTAAGREIIEAVATLGTPDACQALVSKLETGYSAGGSDFTYAIAEALGDVGSDLSRDALIRRLGGGDYIARSCAVALGRIGDSVSRSALTAGVLDEGTHYIVREGCALGLGEIGDDVSINLLLKLLKADSTPGNIRAHCAEALGSAYVSACLADPTTPSAVRLACDSASTAMYWKTPRLDWRLLRSQQEGTSPEEA
jgi:hypothetical protein